jgi:hypothetical protein
MSPDASSVNKDKKICFHLSFRCQDHGSFAVRLGSTLKVSESTKQNGAALSNPPAKRLCADGRTMNVENIGKGRKVEPEPAPAPKPQPTPEVDSRLEIEEHAVEAEERKLK